VELCYLKLVFVENLCGVMFQVLRNNRLTPKLMIMILL